MLSQISYMRLPRRDQAPGTGVAPDKRSQRWEVAASAAGSQFEDETTGISAWAGQTASQIDAFYRFSRCVTSAASAGSQTPCACP
jgi:hypothetical protein